MQLIDSHAHIDYPQFADDREAMFERARAAGVENILAIGTGPGPEKLDAAIEYLRRALAEDPNDDSAHAYLSLCLLDSKRLHAATHHRYADPDQARQRT